MTTSDTSTQLPTYLDPTQTTYAAIRTRLRANITQVGVDLREGSWEGDVLDAAAMELEQAAILAQNLLNQLFAATATGSQMDTLVMMRASMTRLAATYGTTNLTVTVTPGPTVPQGQRFSTTGAAPQYYDATEAVTDTGDTGSVSVPVQAEVAGPAANVPAGAINLIVPAAAGQSIPAGLLSVTNAAAVDNAEATETDTALRARYLFAIQHLRTAGNWADYMAWAQSVNGVGNVAVLETPVGAGSVGVSLLGEDSLPAASDIVSAVQAYIYPASPAEGVGSIGPTDLEIYAAPSVAINVSVTLTYDSSVPESNTNAAILANLTSYLASIAFASSNSVQPDHVGVQISDTVGVTGYDLGTLLVNGAQTTIAIAADHVAVLGTVTVNGVVLNP